jgi:prenyltransferase beta subunit
MGIVERANSSVERCIQWLSIQQDDQGRWMGAVRSNCCIWYAAGLALLGEKPESAVVADICDFVEACAGADGGIGPYPGEPATGLETSTALPLLSWARGESLVVTRAREYLQKNGPPYRDPGTQFMGWLFQPDCRAEILADRGPSAMFQRLLLFASRKHPTERWKLDQKYPHSYRAPGAMERTLGAALMRALTYPPASQLESATVRAPQPISFDTLLLITAGLRHLAGDTSQTAQLLAEYALVRRDKMLELGGAYPWMHPLIADLFFTTVFGREEEKSRPAAAFRDIEYLGNGSLRGRPISINIFDTALTVLALTSAGVPEDHPMVQRACDFLIAAQRPADGLWSFAYSRDEAGHPGQADSDDSGLVGMALTSCGKPGPVRNSLAALRSLQEADGSFSTFGDQVLRPNWRWLSNTSRSLQAMMLAGVDLQDPQLVRGLEWVRSRQLPDGSWIDGWCHCYIYGTAVALEALVRSGAGPEDSAVKRGKDWLLEQQNADGGWGEDWYGGSSRSLPEHTGLAVYALCLCAEPDENSLRAIEAGVSWLVGAQREDGAWEASYFIDFGFGVGFADSQIPVVWALHGLGKALQLLRKWSDDGRD